MIAISNSNAFAPTEIRRVSKALPTSACTVVVETNCGTAYLKALGNDEGPWTLACDLIGTRLANWLGLSTFEFAQMVVEPYHNIQFHNGRDATPGTAFLTRAVRGEQWDGSKDQLKRLSNPHDIGRLVLFDTWTLNCDRFSRKNEEIGTKPRRNLGNVFLEEEPEDGGFVLKAMDHTHCFSCGKPVSPKIFDINTIHDPRIFGLFPEFKPLIFDEELKLAVADLRKINSATLDLAFEDIPKEWEVNADTQSAMKSFLLRRAEFVCDTIGSAIFPHLELPGFEFEDDKRN